MGAGCRWELELQEGGEPALCVCWAQVIDAREWREDGAAAAAAGAALAPADAPASGSDPFKARVGAGWCATGSALGIGGRFTVLDVRSSMLGARPQPGAGAWAADSQAWGTDKDSSHRSPGERSFQGFALGARQTPCGEGEGGAWWVLWLVRAPHVGSSILAGDTLDRLRVVDGVPCAVFRPLASPMEGRAAPFPFEAFTPALQVREHPSSAAGRGTRTRPEHARARQVCLGPLCSLAGSEPSSRVVTAARRWWRPCPWVPCGCGSPAMQGCLWSTWTSFCAPWR